jgi:hypothetical protein
MRSYYIDEHCEADCRADNTVPLDSEVLVFSSEEWYELGQFDLTDFGIDQQDHQSSIDKLNQKHLYDA